MELNKLRMKIDEFDVKLLDLLAQRLRFSEKVADIKNREGLNIYDAKREMALRKSRREVALGRGIDPDFADKLFLMILREARKRMKLRFKHQ